MATVDESNSGKLDTRKNEANNENTFSTWEIIKTSIAFSLTSSKVVVS